MKRLHAWALALLLASAPLAARDRSEVTIDVVDEHEDIGNIVQDIEIPLDDGDAHAVRPRGDAAVKEISELPARASEAPLAVDAGGGLDEAPATVPVEAPAIAPPVEAPPVENPLLEAPPIEAPVIAPLTDAVPEAALEPAAPVDAVPSDALPTDLMTVEPPAPAAELFSAPESESAAGDSADDDSAATEDLGAGVDADVAAEGGVDAAGDGADDSGDVSGDDGEVPDDAAEDADNGGAGQEAGAEGEPTGQDEMTESPPT